MKRIIGISIAFLAFACKKGNDRESVSAAGLLTIRQWILSGHGFDDNKNGILDPQENIIQDCQDDNSYVFEKNGSGKYSDNAKTCPGENENNFTWQLLNNGRELKIDTEVLGILRLNENDLVLHPDLAGITDTYLLVYRH